VPEERILIWGAGRIGRGFVADLFHAAGYRLTLVDQSEELVAQLTERGKFTVVSAPNAAERHDRIVGGYRALSAADSSLVTGALVEADLIAVAVFPQSFPAVAGQLAPGLVRRMAERPGVTLDIILCANLAHASVQFGALLHTALPEEAQNYVHRQIGIVESLVMRMVADPPPEARASDPLLVWTNGFAEFPVDGRALIGPVPALPSLRLVDDMRAEETRKLYTYNMCHAVLAYQGALRGHRLVTDAMADARVLAEAEGALDEVSRALQAEYGFAEEEMGRWNARVLAQTDNPALRDTVARQGADPGRKLKRGDRLVGPALLAREHGIEPHHLVSGVAAGFLYQNPDDAGAGRVRARIAEIGIDAAVPELCELRSEEGEVAEAVVRAYHRLSGELDESAAGR